ncbi:hypothetical protein F2Q68_00030645 [Brassica cretica]|uniref:Uncharacterized protein n=1 Tax=Brassica cretica TaxID=69181 RepID=A0A8S9GF15_BRACR|nr:hypothetical protein F2Q68_00030645 [Brassica cretica]
MSDLAYSSITAVGGVSALLGGALPQVEATSTQPHVDSSVVTEAPHPVESNVSDTSTEADPSSVAETIMFQPSVSPSDLHQEPSFQTAFSSASGDKPLVGEDAVGGSKDAKAEEVVTKKKTAKLKKAGRGVKPTNIGQPDGFQRYSKRLQALKRPRRAMKEKEAVSAVKSTIPITETTRFVGGFTPLLPPTPTRRAAFLWAIQNAKNHPATEADAFQIDTLMTVFECSRVVSQEAIDRVVAYIRKRREGLPSCRFDFLDFAFFSELLLMEGLTLLDCVGCSSVVALMFLELHAIGKELNSVYFNEEHVRTAAENYAIETLQMCQPGSVPPAE